MAKPDLTIPQQSEEWRPIIGYEGMYDVSNHGRVRNRTGFILKQTHTKGYCYAMLNGKPKVKRAMVHSLVAVAFIGPYPEGMEINHRDTNKANNCVENLEYCTASENIRHAVANGLWTTGDNHWSRKHPERVPRGDNHPTRKRPECVARGERHGSKTHPESIRRGDDHHLRRRPELVRRGEAAPRAKLTAEKVREIRRRYANGETFAALGIAFGVTPQAIMAVVHRRTWQHVD